MLELVKFWLKRTTVLQATYIQFYDGKLKGFPSHNYMTPLYFRAFINNVALPNFLHI